MCVTQTIKDCVHTVVLLLSTNIIAASNLS